MPAALALTDGTLSVAFEPFDDCSSDNSRPAGRSVSKPSGILKAGYSREAGLNSLNAFGFSKSFDLKLHVA